MTIMIDLDEDTQKRLEMEADLAGKSLGEYVADYLKSGHSIPVLSGIPNLGWAKGMIHMSDDFDAPLDEFKDYI